MAQHIVTREDLPFFAIESIEEGPMTADTEEEPASHTWRLIGTISNPAVIDFSRWCALLGVDRNCIYGNWLQSNQSDGKLIFESTHDPKHVGPGCRLPFAGDIHAWTAILIEDGPSAWEEHIFKPKDAITTHFVDDHGKSWHYMKPATDNEPEHSAGTVEGGWDHEHCLICNCHIDPGDQYFEHKFDRGYFLCKACGAKYAATGDLSFLLRDKQLTTEASS